MLHFVPFGSILVNFVFRYFHIQFLVVFRESSARYETLDFVKDSDCEAERIKHIGIFHEFSLYPIRFSMLLCFLYSFFALKRVDP